MTDQEFQTKIISLMQRFGIEINKTGKEIIEKLDKIEENTEPQEGT